jgi:hypothetical protein
MKPKAQAIRERYMNELKNADVRELAIHLRLSRMNYSRRCAEASAVKVYQKRGLSLAHDMEIGYVVKDSKKREEDTERVASMRSGTSILAYRCIVLLPFKLSLGGKSHEAFGQFSRLDRLLMAHLYFQLLNLSYYGLSDFIAFSVRPL